MLLSISNPTVGHDSPQGQSISIHCISTQGNYINVIHPYPSRTFKWLLSKRFSQKNCVCMSSSQNHKIKFPIYVILTRRKNFPNVMIYVLHNRGSRQSTGRMILITSITLFFDESALCSSRRSQQNMLRIRARMNRTSWLADRRRNEATRDIATLCRRARTRCELRSGRHKDIPEIQVVVTINN